MNSQIWYGDGTNQKRKTRIIDLISDETKERWKQEEEERKKPKKDLSEEEIEARFKLRKTNLKDMVVVKPIREDDVFKQQLKAEYNNVIERLNNGETISSKDTNLKIQDLQQMLRQDGIATILTIPTRTEGYKLRKA